MSDIEQMEIERLKKELLAANERFDKMNHFKTYLLALTSHQLKTPVGIIRGYATLLREGFYGPVTDQIKEILSKIEFGTEEVVTLVDDLIDLRKIEEGRIEYEMQNVDFVQIARQAAQEMGHMAMSRGLDLSFAGPENAIIVYADDMKLRHVIQNLIDNAVKYTKKGFVALNIKQNENDVVLAVSDSGMGISQEVIPLLFQEFVRDDRVGKEVHGTGMGLFIARTFLEAQGGKIWVESSGVDKGSTFYLSLPKVK
jgi:signal transduction histidine kinase